MEDAEAAANLRAAVDDGLAAVLATLSSPNRLALLRQLRSPRILRELRLVPEQHAGAAPERPIARQAVREHLRKLVEAGVVSAHAAERSFGETMEYVVNHRRLFAISEEFRELAKLRPVVDAAGDGTLDDNRGPLARPRPPCLLVVRGLTEGTGYSLTPAPGVAAASWTIGRKGGCEIHIDYDPFVSLENTLVTWRRGEYLVRSLSQSRNGTTLNFDRLPAEEQRPLRHGDVVGVGRTLFVFQRDKPGG